MKENVAGRNQLFYIVQAALEYLVSILVAGSYLATLTTELGFSDGLTGILSSVISLGCLFQLLSLAVRPKRVKPLVVALSIANQLLFMLLYVVPLPPLGQTLKAVLFVVLIVAAYFLYNLVHPKKINWLMSSVEDGKRGAFTANKEIVSLLSGILFSYGMGALIDFFKAQGQIRVGFVLCAVVILVLTVSHSLMLIFTTETAPEPGARVSLKKGLLTVLKSKRVLQVTLVYVLYNMANYAVTPFIGTYQIKELGLSLGLVAALTIVGSISRILVSKAWGRYADRRSFAAMMEKCLFVLAAAKVCVVLAVPGNGAVTFALYYLFHGVAQGGINSALINLIFDYVPQEQRSDALAISQALSGVAGFVTTLCASVLVTRIQEDGNRFLGLPLYAQQVMALIGCLITVAVAVYVRLRLIRAKKSV